MKITNTEQKERYPWVLGNNPKAIEAQEERGQRELANSNVLPQSIALEDKKLLESMGIVFGQKLPDDPLFCEAELPTGWKIIPTEHSMWSDLVNNKGKKIASIFYKAAFYDRCAFLRVPK